MRRGGPPKLTSELLPGVAAGQSTPQSPAPSTNARYQQLKNSGKRLSRPRHERAAARQKMLRRLDVAGDAINSTPAAKDDIAFLTTFLIHATLPYKDPGPEVRLWQREYRNWRGVVGVVFEAGLADTPDGRGREVGLPYGRYPRLILSWLVTEALTTKSRVLTLKPTFSAWIRDELGVTPTGGTNGTITRVRDAMTRLFNLKIKVTLNGKDARLRIVPLKGDTNFWDPEVDHDRASTGPLSIVLDEDFFREILRASAPFDRRVQNELRSCVAIDLYRFLCLKHFALQKAQAVAPELISYEDLQAMFGQANDRPRDFRPTLLAALEEILPLYPDANTEARERGLLVRPGKPHVTVRPKSPRTLAAASRLAGASDRLSPSPDDESGS